MFPNSISSPLHAPLGLPLTDEVAQIDVDISVPQEVKEQYEVSVQKPTMEKFLRNFKEIVGIQLDNAQISKEPHTDDLATPLQFDPEHEEIKLRLSRSLGTISEPLEHLFSALEHADMDGGFERLLNTPSILDFYPAEFQQRQKVGSKPLPQIDPLLDIGSDSFYVTKKTENVESQSTGITAQAVDQSGGLQTGVADTTASVTTTLPAGETGDSTTVVAPTTVAKTAVTEGISIAHSPVAYDLSGSVPWASYTTTADSFTPISPMEVRYHRVHICSPNIDKPLMVWSVTGPRGTPNLEIPLNGSCPYKTSNQLSLRDKGTFILTESIEQFPLLMHFHGMSSAIYRYWKPRHGASHPDTDQLHGLGKFGQLIKLNQDSEFIPRAFGGNTVKVESHACVLESPLIRAPIFPHKPISTDYVLVRFRQPKSGGHFACTLRPIQTIYCMGQSEPLYRVDVPVVPRLHQVLSSRVILECRRFWLKAKSTPKMDFVSHVFIGERRSLLNRYLADAVRDIQQQPTAPLSSPISPEETCVIHAMKEGIRRLAERGIERIFAISPMRIRNYVRDIEIFERSMPSLSRTPRIAHYCVQLENEMRLSPWNLSNDYWDVMTGKRGAMFQFSPLGDPSGGRGEGVSFRKILKVDNTSSELALNSINSSSSSSPVGRAAGASKGMENLKSKSKKELIAELMKLNVPDRVWRTMSRWQLMRQLALLLGIEDDSEERLAPWKRKALHAERINDAWRKQAKSLSDQNPPQTSASELRRAADAYGMYAVNNETVIDEITPPDSGSEDGGRDLEEMMMDELMGDGGEDNINPPPTNMVDDEAAELELLREIQSGGGKIRHSIPPVQQPATIESSSSAELEKPKITRLQIVSVGRAKSTGNPWSKVTYVYGEKNIALYRKWKELEEEGFQQQPQAASTTTTPLPSPPSTSSWQGKVEMSLKVHRRFQRILKQAAEAGRPIPDVKRCSSCHLFGHDSSFEGCPMLVREMNENISSLASATKKRKSQVNADQSPIYD